MDEEAYQFLPLRGRIPTIGGTHRDAWLDYEVITLQGRARASLSSEARRKLLEPLMADGMTHDRAESAVADAFIGHATRLVRQRFDAGDLAPDVKVNAADPEAMAILLSHARSRTSRS